MPDARRRPGDGEDPAGHPQRPHVPGPRQGRPPHATARTGDLLVTVEVQVPAQLTDDAKAAVEALRAATPEGDLRAAPVRRRGSSAVTADPRPRGAGLRHQRRRRADRAAPADPAHLRPPRPGVARVARAAAAAATPGATSSCCARSPSLTASGIGLEGVRRILELENQVAALRVARRTSSRTSSPRRSTPYARSSPRARATSPQYPARGSAARSSVASLVWRPRARLLSGVSPRPLTRNCRVTA